MITSRLVFYLEDCHIAAVRLYYGLSRRYERNHFLVKGSGEANQHRAGDQAKLWAIETYRGSAILATIIEWKPNAGAIF